MVAGDLGGIVTLLIYLLIACLVVYLVFWALGRSGLQDPFRTVVIVIVVLVMLIFALRLLGLF